MSIGKLLLRRADSVRTAGAIAAVLAGLLVADTANAATWTVDQGITGTQANTLAIDPSWSYRMNGPNCTPIGPATANALPHSYNNQPGLLGWDGTLQPNGPLPVVVRANPPIFSVGGITVPGGAVLMHPGPSGECAVVRFTAPTGGSYTFTGSFYSSYAGRNRACGNGAQPRIVINKSGAPTIPTLAITGFGNSTLIPVPLATGLMLSTNDSVDFMVGSNGADYFCDSTNLQLLVEGPNVPVQMPSHGVTVVTPGPVDGCAPYKLCFDVNVPTGPLPGSSALSLQLYQNGMPYGSPLLHTMNADGQWCFQMPAIAPGQGFDYVLTTKHTYAATATSSGLVDTIVTGLPPFGAPPKHQGQQQGLNNDLVCNVGPPTEPCCPNFMKKWNLDQPTNAYFGGMFSASVPMGGTPYSMSFNNGSANAQSLAINLTQWVNWLKFDSGCTLLAGFRLEMRPRTSTQTTASTAPPYLLPNSSMLPADPLQSVTIMSNTITGTASWPNIAQSPFYKYMEFKLIPIGQTGQPITCNLGKCAEEMFARWHIGSGANAKVGSGASSPIVFE